MKKTEWDAHFFTQSPIFEPFLPLSAFISVFNTWPTFQDLNALKQQVSTGIATFSGMPVRFVPQVCESTDSANDDSSVLPYERSIHLTGAVPTRPENWHDFFNALVWLIFPHAKAALNQIHIQSLDQAAQRKNAVRGPLRDAATLFDESGVIVLSSQSEWITLLRQHAWKTVFWQHRASVLTSMRFILFGHALYEKALNPYAGMTGKGVFFKVEEAFLQKPLTEQLQAVDRWLAGFLLRQLSSNADLSPIPVLGYPGWTEANACGDYYDDQQYFRPLVRRK